MSTHSSLGFTTGDAVRRIEQQSYRVHCRRHGWVKMVPSMRAAMQLAKTWAGKMPGHKIGIHLAGGPLNRSTVVASITKRSGGYKVRFNQALRGTSGMSGLGLTLTDIACADREYTQSWRDRVNGSLVSGAIASTLGGAAGGFLGGIMKRPLLGSLMGAAVGWGAHAIWTAPYEVTE